MARWDTAWWRTIRPQERTGPITIGSATFVVTQAGSPACAYSVSPQNAAIGAAGGTGLFSITTACTWTVVGNNDWLTTTMTSGSGNATVTYQVASNPNTESRSGSLRVGDSVSFVVNQAGVSCTVSLGMSATTVLASGDSGSFEVIAPPGCTWKAATHLRLDHVADPAGHRVRNGELHGVRESYAPGSQWSHRGEQPRVHRSAARSGLQSIRESLEHHHGRGRRHGHDQCQHCPATIRRPPLYRGFRSAAARRGVLEAARSHIRYRPITRRTRAPVASMSAANWSRSRRPARVAR